MYSVMVYPDYIGGHDIRWPRLGCGDYIAKITTPQNKAVIDATAEMINGFLNEGGRYAE